MVIRVSERSHARLATGLISALLALFTLNACTGGGTVVENDELSRAQLSSGSPLELDANTPAPQRQSNVKKSDAFNERVSLAFYSEPISQVLPVLVRKFELGRGVDSRMPISLEVQNMRVHRALHEALKPVGLTYIRQTDGILVVPQEKITFRAFNQPLELILSSMFQGIAYVVRDGAETQLTETVSVVFEDLPVEQALDRITGPLGIFWQKRGDGYDIFRDKEEIFKMNFPLLSQTFSVTSSRSENSLGAQAATSSAGLSQDGASFDATGGLASSSSVVRADGRSSNLNNLSETLKQMVTGDGQLVIHREMGTVYVRDRADVVDRVGRYLDEINMIQSMSVSIRGIITEVRLNDTRSFGVDWDAVSSTISASISNVGALATNTANVLNLGYSHNGDTGNVFLKALEGFGDVRVVSRPSLSVANGAVGSLIVGDTISYVAQQYSSTSSSGSTTSSLIVQPLQTGLNFYVLPHIISTEEAILYVSPELTTLQEIRTIASEDRTTKVEAPSISMRQTQTVIPVRNGESVIIGGLMSETESDSEKGVPVLSRVPLISAFFKSKESAKGVSEFAMLLEVNW